MTKEEIQALKDKINERTLVVSVSGGKDSTATCLHLQEMGLPYRAIFFDTGWEHADTYEYLTDYLPSKIGPIEQLSNKREMRTPELEALAKKYETKIGRYSPMIRGIIDKGVFPGRIMRYCTRQLKVAPAVKYLRGMDDEPINVVGIRAQESRARAKMPEWEWSEKMDCEVWRPLISWTVQDVIEIHQRHNVRPNPLYLGDHPSERVGCYPCIFARKSEIKGIAARSPERIDLIRDLENDVTKLAEARAQRKGEELKHRRAWFQPKDGSRLGTWPIDKAVEWSRTKRGGRQFELFDALPGEQGCVRWGMCDTGQSPKND